MNSSYTSTPTKAPATFRPTSAPFLAPALNTGWIYTNVYLTSTTNSSLVSCPAITSSNAAPDYVVGRRLGSCFANFSSVNDDDTSYYSSSSSGVSSSSRDDSIANYYMYSCSNKAGSLTATQYDNYMCSGTPIGTVTIPIASYSGDDDDGSYYYGDDDNDYFVTCSKSMCSSSSALPLPVNVPYTVEQDYQAYLPTGDTSSQQCYNADQMIAYVNNKCLAFEEADDDDDWNLGTSYMFVYPSVVYYSTTNCSSDSITFIYTLPSFCMPSNYDNDDDYSADSIRYLSFQEANENKLI